MRPFLKLYTGLTREGPGTPEDVVWAANQIGLVPDAAICSAGCGTGADIWELLDVAPGGTVTAIDKEGVFIRAVRQDWAADDRVWADVGDMGALSGEFDLIWSAGAVYFVGITPLLNAWRGALKPGGAIVFSHPCHFTDAPSDLAGAFWDSYKPVDAAGIDAEVRDAGFRTIATRRVPEAGWQIFYAGLAARTAQLRPKAADDPKMKRVLDSADRDIALWKQVHAETGYLLSIVRPE